jgi:hypothetical protein
MAKYPRLQNRLTLAAMLAAALVLPATPAAADAMSELVLFNFGTDADRANREAAPQTPDGPMPLLPVEYAQLEQDQEHDQTSETGAGGS